MSRATVMWSAGKSMLATWLTAGLIYVAIIFLSDLFVYIPAAALAGVVIIAASSLFQPMEIKVFIHEPYKIVTSYSRECGMRVLLILFRSFSHFSLL